MRFCSPTPGKTLNGAQANTAISMTHAANLGYWTPVRVEVVVQNPLDELEDQQLRHINSAMPLTRWPWPA